MSTTPPPFGMNDSINETARKLREVMDLDKASADEIRRWTLVGIVDIHVRMGQLEQMLDRQEKAAQSSQRLTLFIGGLAWTALVLAAFALARVL